MCIPDMFLIHFYSEYEPLISLAVLIKELEYPELKE